MERKAYLTTALIVIILIFLSLFSYCRKTKQVTVDKIDSIRIKNDSIEKEIDKLDLTIDSIQNQYEKDYYTVLHQSTDSDIMFFTDYLSKNPKRFFDYYNKDSVETNKFNVSGKR